MATYEFQPVQWTGGKNVYAVFRRRSDGHVFDFADDTFKALASATTPFLAATERTDGGGSGNSVYVVSLDLARLNKTLNAKRYTVEYFERVGGSPDVDDDTPMLATPTMFAVEAGEIGYGKLAAEFLPVFTTTEGTTLKALLSITRDGRPVNVYSLSSTASAVVVSRAHGSGVNLYTSSAATVRSDGDFEITVNTPGYVDDTAYQHTITITCASETTELRVPLPIFG